MKTLNQLIEENFSGSEQADIRSTSQEKITAIHLQQVRKSRRITQKELARTLGLSQSALSELVADDWVYLGHGCMTLLLLPCAYSVRAFSISLLNLPALQSEAICSSQQVFSNLWNHFCRTATSGGCSLISFPVQWMERNAYVDSSEIYGAIMSTLVEDIKKLSVSERIELVEDIWNSIAEEPQFFFRPFHGGAGGTASQIFSASG